MTPQLYNRVRGLFHHTTPRPRPSAPSAIRDPKRKPDKDASSTTITKISEEIDPSKGLENDLRVWNSLWLSSLTLAGIGTTFTCCMVALLVLWRDTVESDGFTLITANHYTWTYGPTALLVIVVAFWRQVDFHCKAIEPWHVLRKTQQRASENILLDYVSPMQVSSLWMSLRNKHITVTAGIAGFVLLKVITLVSTGLFVLLPTQTSHANVQLVKTGSFSESPFSASSFPALNDSSLVYTAYGILAAGLAYPDGTTDALAYETFAPSHSRNLSDIKEITATVKALVPTFHCESAPVSMRLLPANITDQHPTDNLELLFPQCELLQNGDGTSVYVLNPQTFKCPPRQLSPLLQRIDCFNETDSTTADNWQLLTLADLRYNQTLTASDDAVAAGQFVQASSWLTSVAKLTGIACRSAYSMETVNVTYDYTQNPATVSVSRPAGPKNEKLDGVTDSDIGRLFTSALSAASDMFGNVLDNAYAEEYPNPLFKLMAQYGEEINGQASSGGYESLLDEATMIGAAEAVFQQVSVQIARRILLEDVQIPLVGDEVRTQERLQMNDISLWSMIVGLGIMTILAIVVVLTRARDATPRDPESIVSSALILKNSRAFGRLLNDSSGCSEEQLAAVLEEFTFTTTTTKIDSLEKQFLISAHGSASDLPDTAKDPDPTWWKPLAVRRAFIVATLGIPLVVIAVLELLQRQSAGDSGIALVSNPDSLPSKVLTRYVPALVMLLSASLFNSLEFTVAVLAPYSAMKSTSMFSTSSIPAAVVGLMPPHALWTASRNRYWGACFATAAALLGSVLTIVSSGLYTLDLVPSTSAMQLLRTDSFTTEWSNSVLNDSGAAVLVSLSESLNLTYPRFTYDEIALPGLQSTEDQSTTTNSTQATVYVRLPSLRASLNCTTLDSSQYNLTTSYNPDVGPGATIRAVAPLPQNCLLGGSGGNESIIKFEQSFQFPFTQNTSYVAKLLDLHVGPFDPVHELSEGELSPTTQKDNPPGCPSLGFLYGFVDVNDASRSSATAFMCYQNMQHLPVDVTINLADTSISVDVPPIPDESGVKLLTDGPNEDTSFQYRLQVHMGQELSLFNQTQYASTGVESPPVDRFFQGVLFGKTPVPQAWLGESARKKGVQNGILAFYRRYMAQAISANMRVPTLASEATLLNGTKTEYSGAVRVRQNRASKLVLQVLLGVMCVCGALAVSLSSLREVVPLNPCTIAGKMALWAGSKACEGGVGDGEGRPFLEPGLEFLSDKELARTRILDGSQFRLGWWGVGDGEKRYGINLVRQKED